MLCNTGISKPKSRVSEAEAHKQTFHFHLLSHSFTLNILGCACKAKICACNSPFHSIKQQRLQTCKKLKGTTINNACLMKVLSTIISCDEKLIHMSHMELITLLLMLKWACKLWYTIIQRETSVDVSLAFYFVSLMRVYIIKKHRKIHICKLL